MAGTSQNSESEPTEQLPENGPKQKTKTWIGVILAAAIFGLLGLSLERRFRRMNEIPPPAKTTYNISSVNFYQAYVDSMDFLNNGKALFSKGRALLDSSLGALPTSADKTLTASPVFNAAESFALSLEQFEHAGDILTTDMGGLSPADRGCQDSLRKDLKKYQEAVKIFNEHAKAQYQGDIAKAEKFALSDGMAKWAMAESLLEKNLANGCNGEVFKFTRSQNEAFRRKVFERYRAFYGDTFDQHARQLAFLIDLPVTESQPASPSR